MENLHGGDTTAAGGESMAKTCDYCRGADAVVYCCNDSAFMCLACDVRNHRADTGPRHGRLWICEVCEQEPAAVTCKADAAALCVVCDRDIHSANSLARKHERHPMVQFFGSAEAEAAKLAAANALFADDDGIANEEDSVFDMDTLEKKLDSWFPADDTPLPVTDNLDMKMIDFLFSEAEQNIDFDSFQLQYDSLDSGIPIESTSFIEETAAASHIHAPQISYDLDFSKSNYTSYSQSACSSFVTGTFSQSVSSSSVGVDSSSVSLSEISAPGNLSSVNPRGKQAHIIPNDRVARVLRYQEKRRNRNFKKTVRYASRKAYAETRPRVKGRFTKRDAADPE